MSWYYPKRAPRSATGGIKLDKSIGQGNTRWGERWIESVASFCQLKRLERGYRYAKSGQVLSFHLDQGFATAEVQGSRAQPYKVEIGLMMFTRKQWMRVSDSLLKKAFYTAKLLAGDMPPDMEQIFQKAEAPLFPTSQDDISSDCSCPDVENPCKHIAAAYYILGQEIGRDPFLLLEMRGLGRAQLLAEIQTRRKMRGKNPDKTPVSAPSYQGPAQTNLSDHLNDFFQTPKDRSLTWPADPDYLARLLKPGGRIHEMGSPPFWPSDNNFEEVLTRIYQAVRRRALG